MHLGTIRIMDIKYKTAFCLPAVKTVITVETVRTAVSMVTEMTVLMLVIVFTDCGGKIVLLYSGTVILVTVEIMKHCKLADRSQSQNCATFTSNIWSLL